MPFELQEIFGWFILVCSIFFLLNLLFKILWHLHEIFYPYIIGRPRNLLQLAGADWAVVTGSTDGIGKAYAFELAKKGFNIVLISRSQQKLDAVAQQIHEEHPQTQLKTIAFDFSNPKAEDYEKEIFSLLDNLPIGLLVNNVGITYDYPEKLHKVNGGLKKITEVALINILPVTLLTSRILQQMTQRNRGVIVNISSAAAFNPLIYWGVYSAAKQYMRWFGAILRKEYASTRIHIQTVCPLMVVTKMSAIMEDYPEMFTITPEKFAKSAVRSIGLTNETTGCLSHQIQYVLMFRLLPQFMIDWGVKNNGEATRKKAIEKMEQEQARPSAIRSGEPLLET